MSQKKRRLYFRAATAAEILKIRTNHGILEENGCRVPLLERELIEGIECDICHKSIEVGDRYFSVCTGHYDWGNDSIDSIEHLDVCSGECLTHVFEDYQDTAKGDNTQYLRIERSTFLKTSKYEVE